MDEFIKALDENLNYLEHHIKGNTCVITVISNRLGVKCPFCGHLSSRVHSVYPKTFQDLPIQDKKVVILLNNRKMFCDNPDCTHTTFAERFDCLPLNARKTKRLTQKILDISVNMSSISAARILRDDTANICKSTICNLIKKNTDRNG